MKRCRVNQSLWLVLLFFLFVSFAVPKNCTDDLNLYLPPTDTGTAGSISQFPRVPMIDRDKASISRAQALTNGYYFLQQVGAYYVSAFGLISTAHEADSIATILNKHLVSGIEYGPGYFHQEDISACITVAKEFQLHGIDLWLTSTGPLDNFIRAFNNDVFPSQYRAYSLADDGSIIPATKWTVAGFPNKTLAFDCMNPEAMNWFLDKYKRTYLEPMKQYTSGYFLGEDCLFYATDSGYTQNVRIDYRHVAAYSDAVLALWQKYCINHSVMHNGTVVSKFPVNSAAMVQKGGGKTEHYPGYNVPDTVKPGTSLVSVPRNSGVWAAWDDFVTSQYVETWIGGLSKAVYEVNSGNPNFKGVVYFGLHNWSLAYEEVTDPNFRVDSLNKWVPFGTQRGVSLSKICSLPYVDQIICETFPPIRSGLYQFVSEYKRISAAHGKLFGLMIHRDDNWGLDGWDSETDRWQMIEAFQPTIVARYPIDRLFPNDKYYNEQKENLFDQRLLAYRPVNPIPPAVLSPPAQARNLPTTLTLSWGSCVGASKYHLQVSKDSIFAQLVANDSTISVPSFQLGSLSNGTTYYWRVRGKTPGGASIWSSISNFTTVFVAPSAPTLTAPADIAGNVSITPTLSWAKATGAATYRLQISLSAVFSTTVLNDSTITDTTKTIGPLQNGTIYYWRVSAKNDGETSPWSQVRRFTTIVSAPQAPTLTSPAESAINVQLNPTLNWNPSLGATSYGLQLATTTGFASTVVNDSTITTTSRTVGPLSLATTYYWRVKAKNDGGWSSFSGARQFSTIRTTSVERLGNGIPNQYALSQNYPNPFNPITIIRFALPTGNQVSLKVFDLLGREAATLVTEELGPGYYSVRWRAEVPSGAYIYRLQAGEFVDTRKMVVVH